MSLRYYYRTDRLNRNGLTTINARINHSKSTYDLSTGYKLKPNELQLNTKNGNITVKASAKNSSDLNMRLKTIKLKMDIYLNTNPNSTDEDIKKEFYRLTGKKSQSNSNDTEKNIQEYFDEMIFDLTENQESTLSLQTIKSKRSKIKEFLQLCSDLNITKVNQLKEEHFKNLDDILKNKEREDSTRYKILGELKQFLRWLYSRDVGLKFNPDEIKISNKSNQKSKDDRILNKEEINKIIEYTPRNQRLSKVKDLFLFQFWTGQRVGDLNKITWSEVNNNTWTFIQEKTKTTIKITLGEHALNIIKKYHGSSRPLPEMSSQKYNKYLKELFEEAGINRMITMFKKINGKTTQYSKPFNEIVTSHVARHSFVSFHLANGIPAIYIANQTGQTLKTIETYAKTNHIITSKILSESFGKLSDEE